MKYTHKCAYCSRKADKINSFLGKEKLVGYLPGTRLGIYRDIPVYLK